MALLRVEGLTGKHVPREELDRQAAVDRALGGLPLSVDGDIDGSQIRPDVGRRSVIDLLNTDPARRATRQEFVDTMQERQLIALDELAGSHFDIPEQVRRVETHLSPPGGFIGAYYIGPSEDFSRPGTVWFAVGDNETLPVWDNVSTAYHEGFPGHHLQTGVQMSPADRTSRLQRLWVWYSGAGDR